MIKSKPIGKISAIPIATLVIIAINIVVMLVARKDFTNFALDFGLVPSHLRLGRMISSNFIHDGFVHLSLNMLLLYIFGRELERAMGKIEFTIFYIGGCIVASFAHVAIVYASFPPHYATRAVVGASGALSAVMGFYAVRFHRRVFRLDGIEVQALFLIACWLFLQIIFGVIAMYHDSLLGVSLKYVAYWSHLGGFAFGIIIALTANMALAGEREYLLSEAKRMSDSGNLLEAARNYETLIKYDPRNAHAFAELGRLWAVLGDRDHSIPSYYTAVEIYISLGREKQALAVAQDMRRYWPDYRIPSSLLFRLATSLEEQGDTSRARACFNEIITRDVGSEEAQMSILKISHLQPGSAEDAVSAEKTLSEFLDQYPASEWRGFAEAALARARSEAE